MNTTRIKSTYKIFGGFGLLLIFVLLVSTLYVVVIKSQLVNNFDFASWVENEKDLKAFIILTVVEVMILSLFVNENKYITIDDNEITYTNPLLPFIRKTRQFSEYDFYITTMEQSRGGAYEAIWLIKNNKVKARISSFYYLNYSELKDSLNVVNKGEINTNPFIQPLYLLGLLKVK